MSPVEGRTCAKTGLRLIPVDEAIGFHVAKKKYAQPSAPWRSPDVHRQEWGRFDTLGRTYYLAETADCAYAEVLSDLKRANGSEDPLAPIAKALDLTIEETVAAIAEDWDEADFRRVGALPRTWYASRRLYMARVIDGGWLVDIHHPDSIAALQGPPDGIIAHFLGNQGIPSLNVPVLMSDNRYVTTTLAEIVRNTELDDESTPRGVHFGSKHGGAWCRAIWLPHEENVAPSLEIVAATDIDQDDRDMRTVATRYGLVG